MFFYTLFTTINVDHISSHDRGGRGLPCFLPSHCWVHQIPYLVGVRNAARSLFQLDEQFSMLFWIGSMPQESSYNFVGHVAQNGCIFRRIPISTPFEAHFGLHHVSWWPAWHVKLLLPRERRTAAMTAARRRGSMWCPAHKPCIVSSAGGPAPCMPQIGHTQHTQRGRPWSGKTWLSVRACGPACTECPCMRTRALLLVSFKSFGCNTWVFGYSSFAHLCLLMDDFVLRQIFGWSEEERTIVF